MNHRRHCNLAALVALLAAGSATPIYAQIDPEWVAIYSDGDSITPYALAVDPVGGSYVVSTLTTAGNDDIALTKFDPSGAFAWQSTFDGPNGQDIAADVAVSPDGASVYILGRSATLNFGDADFVIIKYDAATGDALWTRFWDAGDKQIESPQALVALPGGGIVATGGAGTDGFALDYGTVCFDENGDQLWQATFRGTGRFLFDNDLAKSIAITPDGGVVVTGLASLANGSEFRTIKYDSQTGAVRWSRGQASAGLSRDLTVAPNGDVITLGEDILGIDRRWVLTRYDAASGNELWTRAIDPGFDESTRAVAVDAAGNVFATGATDPDGDDGNGNEDIITIALDAQTGDVNWINAWGDQGSFDFDIGEDLWVDDSGRLFVVGLTRSDTYVNGPFEGDAVIRTLDPATGAQLDMGLLDLTDNQTRIDAFKEVGFDADGNAYIRGSSSGDVGVEFHLFVAKYATGDPGCPADFNSDGTVNTLDVLAFLNAWSSGEDSADFNGDGSINTLDVLAFLNAWSAGC